MDDLGCLRCKTTKYRNPQLKLMVNVCGHAICDNCIELLFVKGAAICPECGATLRRSNFRLQLFEDSMVEKEVDIRRRILKDYNKQEDDFPSLHEYNDYLEEVEIIIFNLVNGNDVAETKKKVESYKKENKGIILKNKSKFSHDEAEIEEIIEMELQLSDATKQQQLMEERQLKNAKIKNKEKLIDELMFSEMSAIDIMASHNTKLQEAAAIVDSAKPLVVQATKFSTGINLKSNLSFLPVPPAKEGPLFQYVERVVNFIGPVPPTFQQIQCDGYLNHIRATSNCERAGGFVTDVSCCRAIQEAFSGLFFSR